MSDMSGPILPRLIRDLDAANAERQRLDQLLKESSVEPKKPDFRLECMTGRHEVCAETGLPCDCECHAPTKLCIGKKFAYLTIKPDTLPCDEKLNELGEQGWEVYSVDRSADGAVTISLKRELLGG